MGASPHKCCPEGCLILSDDFDRQELGCAWDVRSGDWDTVAEPYPATNYRLKENGAAGAVVVTTAESPDISFVVAVNTKDEADGDKFRVIVNWEDDNNYFYFEMHVVTAGSDYNLSLHKVSAAGGDEILCLRLPEDNGLSGTAHTLFVCFTPKVFFARVETFLGAWVQFDDPTEHADGYRAGLGNGAAQAIEFDDFEFSEHWYSNTGCPRCVCYCEENPVSPELNALSSKIGGGDDFLSLYSSRTTRSTARWSIRRHRRRSSTATPTARTTPSGPCR